MTRSRGDGQEAAAGRRLIERVRARLAAGGLDLPAVGGGSTPQRWRSLAEVARADVSEARLAEAHVDAVQILGEADHPVVPGAVYGVWASEHPRWTVTAQQAAGGGWTLTGTKAFCTGAGLVDRALISVADGAAQGSGAPSLLLDVAVGELAPSRIDRSMWATTALADTATAVVDLTGVEVEPTRLVGEPGWYLDRPGFWDGAVGPAACWAGAALGLVDMAIARPPSDPHGRAHLGALHALAWHLDATLDAAGREVDADAARSVEARRATALTARHLVDVACAEVQDRFARALGPRALASDPAVVARDHALSVYRRQCHAERDLEVLGDLALDLSDLPDHAKTRPPSTPS